MSIQGHFRPTQQVWPSRQCPLRLLGITLGYSLQLVVRRRHAKKGIRPVGNDQCRPNHPAPISSHPCCDQPRVHLRQPRGCFAWRGDQRSLASIPSACLSSRQPHGLPRDVDIQCGPRKRGGQHKSELSQQQERFGAYVTDNASPLKSRLTIRPSCSPLSASTAPFWLVRMMACAPLPAAAPAPPWA